MLCSSGWRAAQLHGDRRQLNERSPAVGAAGEAASQRRDHPLRTAVPRPAQPGRRLAHQHHRHVDRHRRTAADHQLHLPDSRLHRERVGTVEQPAAVPDFCRATYVTRPQRHRYTVPELRHVIDELFTHS